LQEGQSCNCRYFGVLVAAVGLIGASKSVKYRFGALQRSSLTLT
jgi:hypothetical protein